MDTIKTKQIIVSDPATEACIRFLLQTGSLKMEDNENHILEKDSKYANHF